MGGGSSCAANGTIPRTINPHGHRDGHESDPLCVHGGSPEIQAWACEWLAQLMSDLNARRPDIGELFASHIEQYLREVADFS
jgi:hypothetical protein